MEKWLAVKIVDEIDEMINKKVASIFSNLTSHSQPQGSLSAFIFQMQRVS